MDANEPDIDYVTFDKSIANPLKIENYRLSDWSPYYVYVQIRNGEDQLGAKLDAMYFGSKWADNTPGALIITSPGVSDSSNSYELTWHGNIKYIRGGKIYFIRWHPEVDTGQTESSWITVKVEQARETEEKEYVIDGLQPGTVYEGAIRHNYDLGWKIYSYHCIPIQNNGLNIDLQ